MEQIAEGGRYDLTEDKENVSREGDEKNYFLHRAAFHGEISRVRELLEGEVTNPSVQDKHGELLVIGSSYFCLFESR